MKSSSFFRPAHALVAATAVWFIAGCETPSYEMKVDAISRAPLPAGRIASYRLQSLNPAIAEETLRYQEAAEHIKTALSGRGLWEAPDAASASLVVELDFGIEPPHAIQREVDVAVCGNVQDVSGQDVTFRPPEVGSADENSPGDDSQVVGYIGRIQTIVVCEKHLMVTCSENKPPVDSQPPLALWRVSISIEDASRDLREYLPILASAVMNKIGSATDGVTMESLQANDRAIAFIKRGME